MKIKKWTPTVIVIATYILILVILSPLIIPIIEPPLTYLFGDLTSTPGPGSAAQTFLRTIYMFEPFRSVASFEYMRYSPLFGIVSLIGSLFNLTESWIWAVMNFITITFGFYGLYRLFQGFFSKKSIQNSIFFAILAIFYFLNFYSITRIIHLFMWHTYIILPLFVYLGFSLLRDFKLSRLIAYSIVLVTFAVIPHGVIYMGIFHLGISVYMFFQGKRWRAVMFFVLPLAIFAVINAFFAEGSVLASLGYPRKLNLTELELLSQDASIVNTLAFSNIWWTYVGSGTLLTNLPYRVVSLAISAGVAFFAVILFLRFIFRGMWRRSAGVLLVILLAAGIVIFSAGMNTPVVTSIAEYLVEQDQLNLLSPFREWSRVLLMLPMIYIGVILVFSRFYEQDIKPIIVYGFGNLLLLHVILSPILVTYLRDVYDPVYLPGEYQEVRADVKDTSKVLWQYPNNMKMIEGYYRYSWNIDKTVLFAGNRVENSVASHYGEEFAGYPLPFWYFNEVRASDLFLQQMNIGNIVTRNDIFTEGTAEFSFPPDDDREEYGTFIMRDPITDQLNEAYLMAGSTTVVDPRSDILAWDALYRVGLNYAVVEAPADGATNAVLIGNDVTITEIALDQLAHEEDELVYYPAENATYHQPDTYWSKGSTNNPEHEEFSQYLAWNGLRNYQSDYGSGVLFTYAPAYVEDDTNRSYIPLYQYVFTRDEDVAAFRDVNPVIQFDTQQVIENENEYLLFSLKGTTSGWKTVSTPLIPVSYRDFLRYVWEMKIRYVHEPHFKVIIYDANKEKIGEEFISQITDVSGDILFEKTVDYYVSEEDVAFIQMQIWHGHETLMPLPNEILIKSINIYDLTDWVELPSHDFPVSVQEGTSYDAYAHVLTSPASGQIGIRIGATNVIIDTGASGTAFMWHSLGEVEVEGGYARKVTVQNIAGFNAIDALILIPVSESATLAEYEADAYNAFEHQIFVLTISDSEEEEVELWHDGRYSVELLNSEDGVVMIDAETVSDDTVHLSEGVHTVSCASCSDAIVVLLPEQLTRSNQLQSIVLESRSPIRKNGKVQVQASPSLLVLNEIYDKNWVIDVRRGGETTTLYPEPVFDAVNGYILEDPGTYEISFRYQSGQVISYLKIFSYVVFIAVGGVGVYAWNKKR